MASIIDNGSVVIVNDISLAETPGEAKSITANESVISPSVTLGTDVNNVAEENKINNIAGGFTSNATNVGAFEQKVESVVTPVVPIEPVTPISTFNPSSVPGFDNNSSANPDLSNIVSPLNNIDLNNNFNASSNSMPFNNDITNTSFGFGNNSFNMAPTTPVSIDNSYQNANLEKLTVYKSANDVESSSAALLDEIGKLIEKNITNPTKIAVEISKEAMAIVDEVLKLGGINLDIFNRYEALRKKYEGIKDVEFGKDLNKEDFSYKTDDKKPEYESKENDSYPPIF